MTSKTRTLLAGTALMAILASPASAQNQFVDEGSFGGGSFGEAADPPEDSAGGFGDTSFGDTANDDQQPDTSGNGFGDGSFDSGSFGDLQDDGQATEAESDAQAGSFADDDWDDVTNTGPDTPPPPPPPPPDDLINPPPPPPPNDQTAQVPEVPTEIYAFESRDFGVQATDQMRQGQFHAPTPTEIIGGYVVTTQGLVEAYAQGIDMVVIDVLGGQYALPNAMTAPAMAQGGHFGDRIQQQTSQWLGQLTRGNTGAPIIIYCSDPMCWLSYNAALRAIAAGYTNVYWYRGGIQAWQMAGLRVTPSGF